MRCRFSPLAGLPVAGSALRVAGFYRLSQLSRFGRFVSYGLEVSGWVVYVGYVGFVGYVLSSSNTQNRISIIKFLDP